MKSKINYLGLIVKVITLVMLLNVLEEKISSYWLILVAIPLLFFIVQSVFRSTKAAKSFLISPYNIFSAKATKILLVDLDADLLFEKLITEIKNAKLRIQYADKVDRSILVTTPITFRSWGENIYFDVLNNGNSSEILIQSVALQLISWGKNDENIEKLIQHIDDSFTI